MDMKQSVNGKYVQNYTAHNWVTKINMNENETQKLWKKEKKKKCAVAQRTHKLW